MQAILTELNDNVYIPFFDEPRKVNGGWYKVYHDGGHHVGTRVLPSKRKGKKKQRGYRRTHRYPVFFCYEKGVRNKEKEKRIDKLYESGDRKTIPRF